MGIVELIHDATPVLVANALTISVIYGVWRISKWEREGRSEGGTNYRYSETIWVIVPWAVLIWGFYLWGFMGSTAPEHIANEQRTTIPTLPPNLSGRKLQYNPSKNVFRDKLTGEVFSVNGEPRAAPMAPAEPQQQNP